MAEQPSGRKKGYRKIKLTEVAPAPASDEDRDWPVTDDEALAWLRGRVRLELEDKYRESTPEALKAKNLPETLAEALATQLPTCLPAWDIPSKLAAYRLPSRMQALLAAKAALEGVSVNALVETKLWEAINEPVRTPKRAKADYDRMKRQTVLLEREARAEE